MLRWDQVPRDPIDNELVCAANAGGDQGTSLGFETDWGAAFQYDEYFQFRLDMGLWFPGDFHKFSNVAGVDNDTSMVFATTARIGVSF